MLEPATTTLKFAVGHPTCGFIRKNKRLAGARVHRMLDLRYQTRYQMNAGRRGALVGLDELLLNVPTVCYSRLKYASDVTLGANSEP